MMRTLSVYSLALTVVACNPDKGESNTGNTAVSSSSSGDAATTSDPSTTSDAATAAPTTGDVSTAGSTGDPTEGVAAPCADYCAKLDACGDPRATDCPVNCPFGVAWYGYPGEACGALHGAYLACHTAATCEELAAQPDNDLCAAELAALESDACTLAVCDAYAEHLVTCGLAQEEWKLARSVECTNAVLEARFEFSEACGDAYEALMACVNQLPCEQSDPNAGCPAEAMAEDMACG